MDEFENPLYLHITENPNAILVSPPLTENNYNSWSRSMLMALEVKNKHGLIDGSIAVPAKDDPRFSMWRRCNVIVCSWILRSLSPSIAESVIYLDKAREIWIDLQKRYSQSNPHRIADLQNEIFKTKQYIISINEYFTKSKTLWEQMSLLRPLPVCECVPRCSCNLVNKIRKERDDDRVIRFLDGLNDEYETIKSSVLVLDPIPPMDKVFQMALKLERKLNASLSHSANESVQANATQTENAEEESILAASGSTGSNNYNNNKKFSGKNVPKCTFCGMLGHTIDKCFKKHDYPPDWVPGYKNKAKQNQNAQSGTSSFPNQAADIGLSSEQFQYLVSLLQGQSGFSSPSGQCSSSAVDITSNNSSFRTDFRNNSSQSAEGCSRNCGKSSKWTDL